MGQQQKDAAAVSAAKRKGMAGAPLYRLYPQMRKLADAFHEYGDELRAQGDVEHAIECYREAKELVEICAKFEKNPVPRSRGIAQVRLEQLSNRFDLSAAKRRQIEDATEVPWTPLPNGEDGPTVEETDDE